MIFKLPKETVLYNVENREGSLTKIDSYSHPAIVEKTKETIQQEREQRLLSILLSGQDASDKEIGVTAAAKLPFQMIFQKE